MKTVRVPLPGLAEGERVLPTDTSRYVCRVLRLAAGASFVAFDPESRLEANVELLEPSSDAARVRIGALAAARVVAAREVVLVYALAKGDKIDDTVRDATELGATRIVIARAERSVVKVGDREASKLERWRRIAEQAARQCGRADPPVIDGVHDWAVALALAQGADVRFCLDPHARATMGPRLTSATGEGRSLAFAIGPEGGLTAEEIAIAAGRGFVATTLGPFVLRTETVAAAILGAVRVLQG